MSKLSPEEKSKIIDLWKHKRQQVKDKKQRNIFRRLSFILFFSFLNGFLIYFCFIQFNTNPADTIQIISSSNKTTLDDLKIDYSPFWLLKINKNQIEKKLKFQNPLVASLEIKPVFENYFQTIHLKVIVKEYIGWARFNNDWLLTFLPNSGSASILKNTQSLNLSEIPLASAVLLIVNSSKNYVFWNIQAKNIQKLIYLLSSSLPDRHLKFIYLEPEVKVYFDDGLEINLGIWNESILKRASRIISLQSALKKYKIKSIDLRGDSKAMLKKDKDVKEK